MNLTPVVITHLRSRSSDISRWLNIHNVYFTWTDIGPWDYAFSWKLGGGRL